MPDPPPLWENLNLTPYRISKTAESISLGIDSSLYSANPQVDVVVNYTADLGAYWDEMEKRGVGESSDTIIQ